MPLNMLTDQVAIGVYGNQAEAEAAVSKLLNADIPVQGISVVGGAGPAREASLGNYAPPEFVKHQVQVEEEREGFFEGGALGLLVGFGIFVVTGVGALLVLGPLAGLLSGAGLGATLGAIFGEASFYDVVVDYRKQLIAGNYLVFVEFSSELQDRVKEILESSPSHTDSGKPLVRQISP